MDQEATRSEKRRQLIYYLKVISAETGELLGHLVDITHNGIMILAKHPFDVGLEVPVRIALPSTFQGKDELKVTIESRWHRKDVNPQYFLTGFQIVQAAPADLALIDHLIEAFGFQG